jgi:molybdopterin converting factor small subunit
MGEQGRVTVEFYGIPRLRAGRAELAVPAGTVAEVLAAVERECARLAGLVQPGGRINPHYLLSVDGRRFVGDGQHPLGPGEHVLLLSADAGG